MQKTDIAVPMADIRYPGVKAGILNWPVSAVRLVGRSSQQMQIEMCIRDRRMYAQIRARRRV